MDAVDNIISVLRNKLDRLAKLAVIKTYLQRVNRLETNSTLCLAIKLRALRLQVLATFMIQPRMEMVGSMARSSLATTNIVHPIRKNRRIGIMERTNTITFKWLQILLKKHPPRLLMTR